MPKSCMYHHWQVMFALFGLFDHLDLGDKVVGAFVAHAEWCVPAFQLSVDISIAI